MTRYKRLKRKGQGVGLAHKAACCGALYVQPVSLIPLSILQML